MHDRKINPPIRGHALKYEGRNWIHPYKQEVIGGCGCGAQPEGCGALGVNEVKRWHREHKAAIRAAAPKETPT